MTDIIKKLCITPWPWKVGINQLDTVISEHKSTERKNTGHDAVDYYGGHLICESISKNANRDLIAAAPEMLEALISWCAWVEESGEYEAEPSFIKAIEKACYPKSWEEIKELLE